MISSSQVAVPLSKDDFQLLKVIGKGSFGKVLLVRNKRDRRGYALKILMKSRVLAKKQVEHTRSERKILEEINYPFLSRLEFAVVVFMLKKIQQGAAVPKHLPLPLRSLLPRRTVTAPPVRRVWEITAKKEKELEAVWTRVSKGKETVAAKTARAELGQVCKNPATCRQMWEFWRGVRSSLNLVVSNRETLTKKEFVVAVFMAQVRSTKRPEV